VSLFTGGGDYANEWIMTGTNDREVQGVPATGRSFRVRGASAEMFAQLGIQPPAPPI